MATFEITIDGTPTNGANPWIDSLVWGGAWDDDNGGVVTIGWAAVYGTNPYDQVLDSGVAWFEHEIAALEQAMASWEAVAAIDFVPTASSSADIWYWLSDDVGGLGFHEVPGYSFGEPLFGVFNYTDLSWTQTNLARGGFAFVTLIHELGHGLGLAHPHDGGTAGNATRFPGVTSAFDDYGDYNLNQGIFTTMSYNSGFPVYGESPSYGYGWEAGPMALDIAAIQLIYGANMSTATGNNLYVLPGGNGPGTFWSCIWDAGGDDNITYAGGLNAVINLNPAPLTGANAGGFVSYVLGVYGGFTIANNVTIERASTGAGNDTVTGNNANNVLQGNAGYDFIQGGCGNDQLFGGNEADALFGNDGNDIVEGGGGSDSQSGGNGNDYVRYISSTAAVSVNLATGVVSGGHAAGDKTLVSIEHVMGSNHGDVLIGSSGGNGFHGNDGADIMAGGAGPDRYYYSDVLDSLVDPLLRDRITDFVRGEDMIDMRSMDASTIQPGNNNFTWRGTGGITNSQVGEVRYQIIDQAGTANDFTIIWGDVDADAAAEFAITLNGLHNLTSADFLM